VSCEECYDIQINTGESAYFRMGTANIEIRGCQKHLMEVKRRLVNFDALLEALKALYKEYYREVDEKLWASNLYKQVEATITEAEKDKP
jgi:hypothetical protein